MDRIACASFHAPPPARLPFTSPRYCVPPPSEQRAARIAWRTRILALDDDPALTGIVRRGLAKDHDVVEQHHADAVLASIARGERFDVVVCGLELRALGGIVLYNAVLAISAETARRFVFVVGDALTTPQALFLQSIPNPRLVKPFPLDDLRKTVGLVAARAAAEARSAPTTRIDRPRPASSGTRPRSGETLPRA